MSNSKNAPAAAASAVIAGHDRTRYDGFAITLHWLTFALVVLLFGLSQTWGWFEKPTRHLLIVAHMSFGIMLAAVIVVRIVWRLIPGHQVAAADVGWLEVAAKGVHYLLYAAIVLQALLGFALRWSGNEAMSFFGLQIPPPFAPTSQATHSLLGELHEWNGWLIIIAAAGHATAALYHQFVLKDGLLRRMLPRGGIQAP